MTEQPHRLTDLGNSERLIDLCGADFRYSPAFGWLYWNGVHWAHDEEGEIYQAAKRTIRSLYADAEKIEDDVLRKQLVDHARKSEAEPRLSAMVKLAKTERGIPIKTDELDSDPWLLNCRNGVLNLQTRSFIQPHERIPALMKLAPIDYDGAAACPQWIAFLEEIFDGQKDLIAYVQRAFGASLAGVIREHALFILFGHGANGKSTLVETVAFVLGSYACHTRCETLMVKKYDGIPADVASLCNARFVYTSESDSGRRLAEGLIKALTGGDTITARFLHRNPFSFRPTFKVFLATNHRPGLAGTDTAIRRRIRLIPFALTIPPERQDLSLSERLRAEAPGVLRWLVEGCFAWQTEGLNEPAAVLRATGEYLSEEDVLGGFLDEQTIVDADSWVSTKDLYESYLTWAKDSGERDPLTKRGLTVALKERGVQDERRHQGRGWRGLRLRTMYDVEREPREAGALAD